jgi:hypothetical protein
MSAALLMLSGCSDSSVIIEEHDGTAAERREAAKKHCVTNLKGEVSGDFCVVKNENIAL